VVGSPHRKVFLDLLKGGACDLNMPKTNRIGMKKWFN